MPLTSESTFGRDFWVHIYFHKSNAFWSWKGISFSGCMVEDPATTSFQKGGRNCLAARAINFLCCAEMFLHARQLKQCALHSEAPMFCSQLIAATFARHCGGVRRQSRPQKDQWASHSRAVAKNLAPSCIFLFSKVISKSASVSP